MSAELLRWNIPLTQCSQKLIVVDVGEISNVEETQGTMLFWVFHLYTSNAHGSKSNLYGLRHAYGDPERNNCFNDMNS